MPALTGLGSPHWDPYARGTIVGLTRGTGRAHLARAALEAIAYQTVDAVRAQEAAAGEGLEVLKADGGAVSNRWLMQFQADVLGAPVVVPEIAETTALGAAYLAGIATGVWDAEEVEAMWREAARYEPRMGADERAALLADWRRAVERAQGLGRARSEPPGRNRDAPRGRTGGVRLSGSLRLWPTSSPRSTRTLAPRSTSRASTSGLARTSPDWVYDVARILVTPPCLLFYRARAIGAEHVPTSGPVILAPNHFSQWDHFFAGRLPAPEDPLHGQVPAVLEPGDPVHLLARRRLPGSPRPPGRGGVQDRLRDPRSRWLPADVPGGRPLAKRGAGRAAPGRRPDRARVRRARWSRSRSTARWGCAGGASCASRRSPCSTASRCRFEAVSEPSREQQLEVAGQIFERVQEMYPALDEKGRRGVIKALREGIGATTERQVPAGQPR